MSNQVITFRTINGYIEDLVADFLYYDRKDDETLPRGVIEESIKKKVISIEEIVESFRKHLKEGVK